MSTHDDRNLATLDFLATSFVVYERFVNERSESNYAKELGLPVFWQLKMAAIKLEVRTRIEKRCSEFQSEWWSKNWIQK